jgi:hypothetical protein
LPRKADSSKLVMLSFIFVSKFAHVFFTGLKLKFGRGRNDVR